MWAMHTFKKEEYKQVSWWFSNLLIQDWLSWQSGRQEGTNSGQDALPSQGVLTHTPTLTQSGAISTCQLASHANVWDVGGNWRTQRKTQAWGEHTNSTQTMAPAGGLYFLFFLISVIRKQCGTKRYLKTCCNLVWFYHLYFKNNYPATFVENIVMN